MVDMAGNKMGGLKARETNKRKYGDDFYAKIGQQGGKLGKTGGFASDKVGEDGLTGRERARIAGSRGGQISKRPARTIDDEISQAKESVWRMVKKAARIN